MNETNHIAQIKEEENVITYETEKIKNLIYTIRGKQVMIDSDVALLYQCETKYVNRVVKRNIERFPEEFCFQVSESEFQVLRCQFVTLNKNGRGEHRKYLPYAFTEQGIAMLSALLKSETAIKVSVNIMRAFVEMRKFILNNALVFQEIRNIKTTLLEHNQKFDKVFNELQKDKKEEFKQKIFFKGQIYDAYSLIIDMIKEAKIKLVIIDNYIDNSVLKMLTKKNKDVEVNLLTSQNCNLMKLDIQKFNLQYPTLKISHTNQFHDRFIIIDDKEIYHLRSFTKRFR